MYFYSVSSVFLLDNVNEITAREVFDITTKTRCLVQKMLQMTAFLVNRCTRFKTRDRKRGLEGETIHS
jgi:hypothetical protein